MAQRIDNATQFGDKKGFGVNDTTGAIEPVADSNTALGSDGTAATAKRFSNVLGEKVTLQTDFGVKTVYSYVEEEITLKTDAATTDSTANLLPADAIIDFVFANVTTTIATCTNWALGDATVAARFLAATTDLTAGTTKVGMAHMHGVVSATNAGPTQATAAKLRVTTTGSQTTAGKIKVTVFYHTVAMGS